jgi:hypothetical protein
MNIKESNKPWKHWIIDDFLDQEQVKILQDFSADHIEKHNMKSHFNSDNLPDKQKEVLQSAIGKMPRFVRNINYQSPREYKKIYALGHLAVNPAGYSFQPHCDDETKVWTFVTYIGPENSIGTYVMSNMDEKNKIEIPWKPGRCLVFAGNNGETWHSYESGNNWRATITAYMNTDKNWGK